MNPWPFVAAAYGVTFVAMWGLALVSYLQMRRAEDNGGKR